MRVLASFITCSRIEGLSIVNVERGQGENIRAPIRAPIKRV